MKYSCPVCKSPMKINRNWDGGSLHCTNIACKRLLLVRYHDPENIGEVKGTLLKHNRVNGKIPEVIKGELPRDMYGPTPINPHGRVSRHFNKVGNGPAPQKIDESVRQLPKEKPIEATA